MLNFRQAASPCSPSSSSSRRSSPSSLITLILMQRSEGGGLAGGGSPAGMMSARGASDFLTRGTAILATIFVALSIVLAGARRRPARGRARSITSLGQQAPPLQPARRAGPAGAGAAGPGPQPATQPHRRSRSRNKRLSQLSSRD